MQSAFHSFALEGTARSQFLLSPKLKEKELLNYQHILYTIHIEISILILLLR